jgi:molybdopterin converting factor small subunit
VGELELELAENATAQAVAALLAERFPSISRHLNRAAYAINRNYVSADTPLRDGDELALIPPVSGG